MSTIAIVGSSGFIGRHCASFANNHGHRVVDVPAPRLSADPGVPLEVLMASPESVAAFNRLRDAFRGVDVIINAAGKPDATGARDAPGLFGANYLLPQVVACSAQDVGASRLLHISTAAVQGTRALDESETMLPFSPYSRSKAMAEVALRDRDGDLAVTRFRPTSVQGLDRGVSRALGRFARSPFSSVAGGAERHTPQVLVENVASAVMHCAVHKGQVPPVVLQPSEGLTCRTLLEALGQGRRPRSVSRCAAKKLISMLRRQGTFAGHARRLEMVWFGQEQASGWLTHQEWEPLLPRSAWIDLGRELKIVGQRGSAT